MAIEVGQMYVQVIEIEEMSREVFWKAADSVHSNISEKICNVMFHAIPRNVFGSRALSIRTSDVQTKVNGNGRGGKQRAHDLD